MVKALAERASKGVRVRVVLDAVGCARSHRQATSIIGAAGGQVRLFMPLRHSPIRGRTNLRSHRKLAIFDQSRLLAGGMNLADEYMGLPRTPLEQSQLPPRWRDVAAMVSGPIVADALALFESDWRFCGGTSEQLPAAVSVSPIESARADTVAQFVASGPDMTTDTVYDLFLTVLFGARERVVLVTPYYVPDDPLQHALILAARRGVRTELLVPLKSNHSVADVARRSLLRELTAAGVQIHYYPEGMVHAKAMVVDDTFAYVGSPNFDMRSLFLNYENAICVYSSEAIGQIRTFADGLMAQSTDRPPTHRPNWLTERVARLLAPEL
jgi:cardiolipin synthase